MWMTLKRAVTVLVFPCSQNQLYCSKLPTKQKQKKAGERRAGKRSRLPVLLQTPHLDRHLSPHTSLSSQSER